MITDDHAHLDHEWLLQDYKDISSYLEAQKKAGVKYIIANSLDRESSENTLAMHASFSYVLPAIGLYPVDERQRDKADDHDLEFNPNYSHIDEDVRWIKGMASKCAAIGEVGLDHANPKTHKEAQQHVFTKMIDIALAKNKPLIVHSRKAEAEVLKILDEKKAKKVVLHCFTGSKSLINEAIRRGYNFSIPTSLVRTQQFQMMVDMVDMSRILTETDAPFMSPYRDGKPNESRFIEESLKVIAKIKGMDVDEVAKVIFQNFQRLYL